MAVLVAFQLAEDTLAERAIAAWTEKTEMGLHTVTLLLCSALEKRASVATCCAQCSQLGGVKRIPKALVSL